MSFALRARFDWRLRRRTVELSARTLIMGILNVTPDSFSDGGEWLDVSAATSHALAMLEEGADIIDVGGESTRPNATVLTPAEEQARVMPVLQAILAARPDAIVSIDTYHAETARMAVQEGAEIVNDVSGHLWDPEMSAACASLRCGAVLMHTRGRPQDWRSLPALDPARVIPMVLGDLQVRAQAAMAAGVGRASLVLDPGFGFGKAFEENFPLLARFNELEALGFPLLAGVSRKGFLRRGLMEAGVTGESPESLLQATCAAHAMAILAGAHILRVHDVAAAKTVAAIADRTLAARA